ncbi:MAG: lipopolysaccharide transport system permease protein [Acidimicrobiaceae bacterium]
MTSIDIPSSSANLTRLGRLRPTWELLLNLTSRELKIRYKRSVLGFFWSLLNPLMMMAVFTVIFTVAFKAPIHDFPLFFLSAYLPWAFFQASAQISTGVIIANAGLIKKVYFPRVVLPLSVVLSQLVHLLLGMCVLLVALAIDGYNFLPYLPVLVASIALLTLFTAGVSMLFAAANVVFRDIQEFSNVLFLLWFYMTPVIYSPTQLTPKYRTVLHINPMYYMVQMLRSSIYELRMPSLAVTAGAVVSTVLSLVAGGLLFRRLSIRFAKEI